MAPPTVPETCVAEPTLAPELMPVTSRSGATPLASVEMAMGDGHQRARRRLGALDAALLGDRVLVRRLALDDENILRRNRDVDRGAAAALLVEGCGQGHRVVAALELALEGLDTGCVPAVVRRRC
jgi:hypothetical protein